MAGDSTPILEVRFRDDARADFASKMHPMVRRQARLTVFAGVVFAVLLVGATAFGLAEAGELANPRSILLLIGFAAPFVLLIVLGVRRGKHRPTLPEVALTITRDEVVLAAVPRFRLIRPERPERRWSRHEVTAEFVKGTGVLTHDRIEFTTGTGWKRRVQGMALMPLDASADEILAALER